MISKQVCCVLFGPMMYLISGVLILIGVAVSFFYVLLGLGAFFIVVFTMSEVMEYIEGQLALNEMEKRK